MAKKRGLLELRKWLVSPPSEFECRTLGIGTFGALDDAIVSKMSLHTLFLVGGFSDGAPLSSVRYSGGNFLSALSLKHRKATATRLLKSNESHGKTTRLSDLYGSATEREKQREKVVETAVKRHGETSPKLRGPDNRVPVSLKRGYVTDDRFFANVDELRSTGVFVKSSVQNPGADSSGGDVLFTILLQSLGQLNKAHAEILLSWLKEHPLLVFDPGLRWIVSGILARLIKYEMGTDGSVKLEFAYRNVRVSGRKWRALLQTAFWSRSWRRPFKEPSMNFPRQSFFGPMTRLYVAKMFTDNDFPAQVET
jgi:hypothetical protein